MQRMDGLTRCAAGACVLLVGLGGCSKEIPIVQIPSFYRPDLKTIAVVPFRNRSALKNAGHLIADKVANALMANRTYKVFNRNDLKPLMDANDLKIALGGDSAAAAAKFKQLTDVQAILVGAVTTYSATSQSQRRQEPRYYRDRRGNRRFGGYSVYTFTRNEANVSVTAALIRVSDGTTIHATASPARSMIYSHGSPPKHDPYACAEAAANRVISRLVATFAVVRRTIKVDPSKALRTATERYDAKWTASNEFPASADRMFVVLALPACCDRNRFRLAVVRKGDRADLATRNIQWTSKYAEFGYAFSPRDIAAKGGGPGLYEVKFYAGPEPVLRHAFRIK